MKAQLKHLSSEARKIMDDIPKRVKHKEKIKFLELVVKNHFLELENNEMQYNLKLQEKMHKILKNEIDRLKGVMKKHNIAPQKNDEEEPEILEEDVSPPAREHSRGQLHSASQQQPPEYDFSKKRAGSKDRGMKAREQVDERDRRPRANSPGLNTQEIGKIRWEIDKAQEVLNQMPTHLKEKARQHEGSLYDGIKGAGILIEGDKPKLGHNLPTAPKPTILSGSGSQSGVAAKNRSQSRKKVTRK